MKGEWGTRVGCRRVRDERGQVVVLFALFIPMLLALAAIVMDVGNMYVHKKNLQTLVDAAAFAGATKFVGCSFQFGDPVAANNGIRATALQYAGDTTRSPGTLNLQVQKPNNVHVVLNSARYWDATDQPYGVGLDNTLDTDGNPLTPGDPCSSRTLDVKATDHDVTLLTNFFPFKPDAKSKARVEIRQVKEQMGILPFAVPEIDPAAVVAIFVNEITGSVLATQLLLKNDDDTLPFAEWKTSPLEESVNLQSENTGVVILVSKQNNNPMRPTGGPGTLTTICSQSPNLVKCYAGDGNESGLTFIHGWSDASATPAAPKIRDFSVTDVDCATDDDSAPYFLLTGDCHLGAIAKIDFGVTGDPRLSPPTGAKAEVALKAPGCPNNKGCPMSWLSTSGTTSTWYATGATLDPAIGRSTFSVDWKTDSPAGSGHSGTFTGVAHPYVATDASGPVQYLKLATSDPGITDPNSRNQGTRSVSVTVGLNKPLQIRDPLAPSLLLRYASPTGSLNQALDCDRGITLKDEIANGCQTPYGLNYDNWDHDTATPKTWADITCTRYGSGDLPPVTPTTPAPICVAAKTGDVISFRQGLKARFETPSCTPNNWPKDTGPPGHDVVDDAAIRSFFTTYDLANDKRYVTLVITDITAFEGSGSTNVPVKYFAGFYATGWDVGPQNNGCPDNDPHPLGLGPKKDNGDVWGHFINIVAFSAAGLANDQLCNFDELGNCIAVLVE
jgi:Flp pilus assembly protein TadG